MPEPLKRLFIAVTLLAVAGCVDAIGYLRLRQLFASFISGNTTRFGVFVARADGLGVARTGLLVLLFVAGSFGGHLITQRPSQRRFLFVLLLETTLILSVPLLGRALPSGLAKPSETPFSVLIVPLVLAMGLQNASLQRVGPLSVGTTYVTGILAHLGQQLAGGGERRRAAGRSRLYALLWLGLVLGAVSGGVLYSRFALDALFAPGGVLALLFVTAWLQPLTDAPVNPDKLD